MTEEYFQTYDAAGNPLDRVVRSDVHRLGLWHRAANVLLYRSNGDLVVQQRAADKDVCPGLWDLSAAEHLRPDESFLEAARRGLTEELGIEDVELTPIGDIVRITLETGNIRDREFQQTYRGVSDAILKPDPVEVAAVSAVAPEALRLRLRDSPEAFTPWFRRIVSDLSLLD